MSATQMGYSQFKQAYFSSLPQELMGYIAEVRPQASSNFDEALITMDHVQERLLLRVQYVLLERGEMERNPHGYWRLIGARIRKAMGISDDPTKQALQARMARRQMMNRGREAAQRKARRA